MSGTWDALAAGTPGDDAPVRGRPALWLDLPNRRIRDPNVRWGGRGEAARPLPIPIDMPSDVKRRQQLFLGLHEGFCPLYTGSDGASQSDGCSC